MSYIYVAEFKNLPDVIKVGISVNPVKRLKHLARDYGKVKGSSDILYMPKSYKQSEKLIHQLLTEYKETRLIGDGNTEFFTTKSLDKLNTFVETLSNVEEDFEHWRLEDFMVEVEKRRKNMSLNLRSETTNQDVSTIKLSKITRGQRINLSKEQPSLKRVLMKLVWEGEDLDASVVLLNNQSKFIRKDDQSSMVFYHNLTAAGITHSGDLRDGGSEEVVIELDKVEAGVETLMFVATSHAETPQEKVTFGQVRNAKAYLINADTNEALYEFDLEEDHSTSTAVEMARLYKKDNEWRFTSLEEDVGTFHMGLQAIVDKYNV